MPSFPPFREPLTDGVVALRLSAERDIPEVLIAYQDDPTLPGALGESRPPSGAALGRRAEQAGDDLTQGRAITLTILEAGTDTCRGEVRLAEVDWESGRARLTIWVAPQLRGHGIGRRAHALVRDWLLEACGLAGECAGPRSRHLTG